MFKSLKWEDWSGIALGAWLLVSPWLLGHADHYPATINALLVGCVLVFTELLNLDAHENAEEWLDLAAGLWLVASPWVLGFSALTAAALNAMAVGLLTLLFAGLALSSIDEKIHDWRQHRGGS
jgi:SPW repeat-containing protein